MNARTEIVGQVVAQLRARRRQGTAIEEILSWLHSLGLKAQDVAEYLGGAFFIGRASQAVLAIEDPTWSGDLKESMYLVLETAISCTEPVWAHAPVVSLMRRRDRYVFREFARRHDCLVIVAAARRACARYIGKAGFRPSPPELIGVATHSEPQVGLIGADPRSEDLHAVLATMKTNYQDLVAEMEARGFRVCAKEHYIFRDEAGRAFYDGYYLQGVYCGRKNLWSGDAGERLRAELNRDLGEDLVQSGPQDCWDFRIDGSRAGGRGGPQLPAIAYFPDGQVLNLMNLNDLKSLYEELLIPWEQSYPAARPETGGEHARAA